MKAIRRPDQYLRLRGDVWHLDEIYTKINGKKVYLWRAVDDEGTIPDVVVPRRRNTKAATRSLRKLLRNQGIKPTRIFTDRLGSYGASLKLLGLKHLQDVEGENENLRTLAPCGVHKSFSQLTAKSITFSITDDTSSQETHFESSELKRKPNGILLRIPLACERGL